MASVYKRDSERHKKNAPYYVAFTDHEGKRRNRKGFTDRGLTEQLGAKLENEVMLRRRGLIDPVQETPRPSRRSRRSRGTWRPSRRASPTTTPKHVKLTMTRVRRVVDGLRLRDDRQDRRRGGRAVPGRRSATEEDLGARTYNHYLQAFDEFGKWLVDDRSGCPRTRWRASTAERRDRRPAQAAGALAGRVSRSCSIRPGPSGEVIQGYDGETRARIYLFSFLTGLRRQEMGSLTPRSFDLDDAAADADGRGRMLEAPPQGRPADAPGTRRAGA